MAVRRCLIVGEVDPVAVAGPSSDRLATRPVRDLARRAASRVNGPDSNLPAHLLPAGHPMAGGLPWPTFSRDGPKGLETVQACLEMGRHLGRERFLRDKGRSRSGVQV